MSFPTGDREQHEDQIPQEHLDRQASFTPEHPAKLVELTTTEQRSPTQDTLCTRNRIVIMNSLLVEAAGLQSWCLLGHSLSQLIHRVKQRRSVDFRAATKAAPWKKRTMTKIEQLNIHARSLGRNRGFLYVVNPITGKCRMHRRVTCKLSLL